MKREFIQGKSIEIGSNETQAIREKTIKKTSKEEIQNEAFSKVQLDTEKEKVFMAGNYKPIKRVENNSGTITLERSEENEGMKGEKTITILNNVYKLYTLNSDIESRKVSRIETMLEYSEELLTDISDDIHGI